MDTSELVAGLREIATQINDWAADELERLGADAEKWRKYHAEPVVLGVDQSGMAISLRTGPRFVAVNAEKMRETVEENERLRAEVERMRQAASSVLSKSYEASAYVGGLTKSRAYWDEYDEMMAPLWIALADAKGGG